MAVRLPNCARSRKGLITAERAMSTEFLLQIADQP